MPKIPYRDTDRDLSNLAAERVSQAIASVMQLADTPEQMFIISMKAMTEAIGACAGCYAGVYGTKVEDPIELAISLLNVVRDTK